MFPHHPFNNTIGDVTTVNNEDTPSQNITQTNRPYYNISRNTACLLYAKVI